MTTETIKLEVNKKLALAILSIALFGIILVVMAVFAVDSMMVLIDSHELGVETHSNLLLEVKMAFDSRRPFVIACFFVGILILFFNQYRAKWYFWTLALFSILYIVLGPTIFALAMFVALWLVLLLKRKSFFRKVCESNKVVN